MAGRKANKQFGPSLKASRAAPKAKTGPGGSLRARSTINRILMEKTKVKRDKKTGEIIKGYVVPKSQQIAKGKMARIAPDRTLFGNTKVIGQKQMENFREALQNKIKDPYTVLLKAAKLPMSLLKEPEEQRLKIKNRINFQETFGPNKQRKRVKLQLEQGADYNEMQNAAEKKEEEYQPLKDSEFMKQQDAWYKNQLYDPVMQRGQSKRVWGELYKVIDSSDVLVQVLDVRDPMGTRSPHIERYLKSEKAHKHLIFVLNKCDLVPTWVTVRWVKVLSQEHPTIAFHASISNPFGKGSLIQLLRQFAQVHRDKKSISVGMFGYPNVGKSSLINTLRKKKVSKVSPLPGETKVWQYVMLMRRIFLIDCPGVIHNQSQAHDTPSDIVLKGVVRAEKLEDCSEHVIEVLRRVKKEYIQRHYKIIQWKDHFDFLDQLAKKSGKLLKEGRTDYEAVSRRVLFDWQRGRLPWFNPPPFEDQIEAKEMSDLRNQIKVKQLFYNIKLADEVSFTKNDRHGVGFIPEDKKSEIIKEVVKPEKKVKPVRKQQDEQEEEEEEEEIDWDEVYKNVSGKSLEKEPMRNEDGDYFVGDDVASEDDEEEEEQDDENDQQEEEDAQNDDDDDDDDEPERRRPSENEDQRAAKKKKSMEGRAALVMQKQSKILSDLKSKREQKKEQKKNQKIQEAVPSAPYIPKSIRRLIKKT
ncbi:nuclear GTP-binding protein NUG2 [Acrasis kona]|uniref:Nucleolar GTP-binding protein 2 n=1 Tax=Acrasis kona TaxID=1008807 RepID=A0AAW2ZHT2_9EUKA